MTITARKARSAAVGWGLSRAAVVTTTRLMPAACAIVTNASSRRPSLTVVAVTMEMMPASITMLTGWSQVEVTPFMTAMESPNETAALVANRAR